MNLSQLPAALRRLAAQIERGGFDPDTRVNVLLGAHGINSADELRKWLDMLGPQAKQDTVNDCYSLSDYQTGSEVAISAFYEPSAIVSDLAESAA